MSDDKLVEAVARAICARDYERDDMWDQLPETEAEAVRQFHMGNNESIAFRGEFRDTTRATLSAIESHGYRVVPVEPSEAMVDAHDIAHARAETIFATVQEVWTAMLAAAPKVTG